MNRPVWTALLASLDLCAGTRNFANSLDLQRVDNGVLHLKSQALATRSSVDKLCAALSRHTGQPIAVVLRHGPTQAIHRSYTDQRRSDRHGHHPEQV